VLACQGPAAVLVTIINVSPLSTHRLHPQFSPTYHGFTLRIRQATLPRTNPFLLFYFERIYFTNTVSLQVFNPPAREAPTDSPLRFGILGAAGIAPIALIYPVKNHPDAVVKAVAARDQGRADAFAKKHGIPRLMAVPARTKVRRFMYHISAACQSRIESKNCWTILRLMSCITSESHIFLI